MSKSSFRPGRRLLTVALVVSVVGAPGPASAAPTTAAARPAGPGVGTPARTGAPPRPAAEPPRTVTLITGDRVVVRAGGAATVRPGAGRAGIPVQVRRGGGRLNVLPADAAPLVRAGRLDPRLFDVTTLLDFGYDDDRRADLPLIVTAGADGAAARAAVPTRGARVVRELPAADAVAIRADKPRLTELWRGIADAATGRGQRAGATTTVWLDGLRRPTLDRSVPQIGAPTAWQAGFDGSGVKVAVLDSGIDAGHPDVAGQVVGRSNFTDGEEDDRDLTGHGTHVASTIAGTGAASAGRYRGVAPGARLLDGKVCVEYGCAESSILAGMQWAAEQGATVVNMSLGGGDTPEVDPLEQAVRTLTDRYDTLFVVAAGNAGADGTVDSPGSADAALTVGAVDRSDDLAGFSSRGPRVGDGAIKPDITAPGVEIVAANSPDGFMGPPGEPYTTSSGTSMATPHVAGAAAILAQRHPEWTAEVLKSTLMASAVPHPELGVYAQGAGRVDVGRAIGQTLRTDPPAVGFTRQVWPHTDDVPQARSVTYANSGAAPVTLALSVESTGPDGRPAPDGMFALSTSTVSVPAGGTAQLGVTVDTRAGGADGFYTGWIVGSAAGGVLLRTPLGVDREVESYDLTVTHVNRAGEVTSEYETWLVGLETGRIHPAYDPDGTVTIRVPKGRYTLMNYTEEELVDPEHPEHRELSLLAWPELEMTASASLTVDARSARPLSVTVPRADATGGYAIVLTRLAVGDDPLDFQLLQFDGFTGMYTGQLGDGGPVDGLDTMVNGLWARAGEGGSMDNSPFLYNLGWFHRDGMLDGLTRAVRPEELATVRSHYAKHVSGPDVLSSSAEAPVLPGVFESTLPYPMRFDTPFERTEYFNTDGGVRWRRYFEERAVGENGALKSLSNSGGGLETYRAGTVIRRQWNQGVFGPSLGDPVRPEDWVSRVGDELLVSVPMFGDGAGRPGGSVTDAQGMTLYRDGAEVAEADALDAVFEVPAAAADYRLEATASRGAPFTLSTRVEAMWTFRSARTAGQTPVRLPLSTVRFSPRLDQENTAPAGRLCTVPVSVRRQPGSAGGAIRSLTVDVSYDDGVTWRKATVLAAGGTGVVLVRHPAGPGFVSLRAAATDRAGNTVRQTVIRAYAIAG